MDEIEKLAQRYAMKRELLAFNVEQLQGQIDKTKKACLPTIRRAAEQAADARADLLAAVAARPDLFQKPRTRILHGIRVGIAKGKGKVSFASPARVVTLIRKHLADRFEELVKVTETPLKGPLGRLSAAELKKIGVTLEDTGDQVVVAPADSEIDKLVDALLASAEEKEAAE